MFTVDLPSYPDLVVRWFLALAVLLMVTALFRDRFSIEGAAGYLWVMAVVVPANIVGPAIFQEMGFLAVPETAEIWLKMFLLNTAMIYALSAFLPGLATEGHFAPFLISAILAAVAVALFIMPEIPILPTPEL